MDERDAGLPLTYPLSAVVGNDPAKMAVSCLLASRRLKTLLIYGPAGTGKTLIARSAAALSGGRRTVELPLNATGEQVFGSLDMDDAIRNGSRTVSDSIMRRANGNIIVADNANLLPKDILHGVLDAVLGGIVRAEMDGLSVCENVDTMLIATMDPSEAELDAHELDRFDLCVRTDDLGTEDERTEVVRRALAFVSDPSAFRSSYKEADDAMASRILLAEAREVPIGGRATAIIAAVCENLGLDGHRGDIAAAETAATLAALDGRGFVSDDDVRNAVGLCLMHRCEPAAYVPAEPETGCTVQADAEPSDLPVAEAVDGPEPSLKMEDVTHAEGAVTRAVARAEPDSYGDETMVFAAGGSFDVKDFIPRGDRNARDRDSGRRGLGISEDASGRCIGYVIPRGRVKDVALSATIRTAAPYQRERRRDGVAIAIMPEDLREKVRVRRKGTKILFVVDGSGSINADARMMAVKGAILSILDDAYKRRDMVGLVVFRGTTAEEVLPLTRSVSLAYTILSELPTGGRTPLVQGLRKGYDVLRKYSEAGESPVMVVLTDGWGNVSVDVRSRGNEELKATAEVLRDTGIRMIIVDTERKDSRYRRAGDLAAMLGADYVMLDEISTESLSASVNTVLENE